MGSSSRVTIALAWAVLAVACGVADSQPREDSQPKGLERVGVEVAIALSDPEQSVYECTAVITDLDSGEVKAAPKVRFRAGEPAAMRTGTQPGIEVMITVSVDKDETEAWYQAKIYRDRTIVSSQRVRVALGGS